MSIEDLLHPRYLLEHDFPHNNYYKVGDIITDVPNMACRNQNGVAVFACEFDKFPANFRPLQWWEKRKPEDMPDYVKLVQPQLLKDEVFPEFMRIEKWIKIEEHFAAEYEQVLIHPGYIIPATEHQDIAYTQSK